MYCRDKLSYCRSPNSSHCRKKSSVLYCTVETNCPIVGALIAATVGRKAVYCRDNCPVVGALIAATVGRQVVYCAPWSVVGALVAAIVGRQVMYCRDKLPSGLQ